MQLTKHEKQLAKAIWKRTQAGMAFAKADRHRILDEMQTTRVLSRMAEGLRHDRYSENMAILQQTAALAENSAMQQEIMLHCTRQFSQMVSQPD